MSGKLLKLTHMLPMAVVGKHILIKPVTVQYPEEKLTLSERYRGLHVYDSKRCMGCGACARICPTKVINIQLSITPDGKKKIEKFEVFLGRCMFCGLCQDYCPGKGVIKLTREYEVASNDRKSLIYDVPLLEKKESDKK